MSRLEDFTEGEDTAVKAGDRLIRELRALPTRGPSVDSAKQTSVTARAAFVHAFQDASWHAKVLSRASRATVPVVLASVVGLYLFWAFAAAIALHQ
jgi:hypothetical protein